MDPLEPSHHSHRHAPRQPAEAGAIPEALATIVDAGCFDAAFGGLAWTLLEGGCPLVVASPGEGALRRRLLGGLLEIVAPGRRLVDVLELEPTDVGDAFAVAGDLGTAPFDPARARAVAGALSVLPAGLGLGLALEADSLDAVLRAVAAPGMRTLEDRRSYLGLVLIVDPAGPATPLGRLRVAHYVRPIARDAGGHVQRLPPAVLASRDAADGRLEDFSWGVASELAARVGRSPVEFGRAVEERGRRLGGT